MDADLNAAKNHSIYLPDIRFLLGYKLNIKNGFFWNPNGVFDINGQEIRVPDLYQKRLNNII
jgi:hypothetical protein